MFLFEKIISRLLFPLPLCVEILAAGLALLWLTRKQKAGKILVSIGVGILLLASNPGTSGMFLKSLERQYPPYVFSPGAEVRKEAPAVRFIVVLSGGFSFDPQIPITSQVRAATMIRLIEGIRLYREFGGCQLIFSGGAWLDPAPEAEGMAKIAQALGVKQQDIVLETESRDTEDQARLIKPLVGSDPFILVTSASHMLRSMAVFKHLGMKPVAAPTDHWVKQTQKLSPDDFFPNADGLGKTERAVYEYLGIAWAEIRGKM